MKKLYRFSAFIFTLIIAVAGCIPASASNTQAERYINSIIDYNLKNSSYSSVQSWIDGELTQTAGVGAEWYILALSNHGIYDFSRYQTALEKYLSENITGSASSRLKLALTLIATGDRSSQYITDILESSTGEQGIMSLIFGLHIINNGYSCKKYSENSLLNELLNLQLSDGGWSLNGTNGDVDVTAMAVQALAPHCASDASVKTAIDKALAFLSARQEENGGYSSYGVSNPESIAQVIIALSTLGIDVRTDKRFIKNGKTVFDAIRVFELQDSSFCHKEGGESDSTSTVQVFCAAVSYCNMKKGKSPFYIFDRKPSVSVTEKTTVTTTSTTSKTALQEMTSSLTGAHQEKTEPPTITLNTTTDQSGYNTTADTENKADVKSYKPLVIIVIVIAAVVLCAVLLLLRKIRPKDCLTILLVMLIAILFVAFTNFESVESHYNPSTVKENVAGTVTLAIRCDAIKNVGNPSVPENGIILGTTEFQIQAGDTVYDILSEACEKYRIHIETSGTGSSLYVEGISYIYETDFGDLSGWMYFVNGKSPDTGCGGYEVHDGDLIEWHYTCEMGKDLNTYR